MANPISVPSDPIRRGELDPDTRTPPEKSSILPLTPPASSERRPSGFNLRAVLNTLDDCRSIHLRQIAVSHFIRDRIASLIRCSFDYDPRSELLYIRMPTPVHNFFSTAIANEIHEKLKALKAAYPGVVLECSNGDIKVVISIDINYGFTSSTISLWRLKFVREEGEELDILDRPFNSLKRLRSKDEAQFRLKEDRAKQRADIINNDFLPRARKRNQLNR
ncbi:hypothetical protein QBC46DRAFT_460280 [Diplogelasinospora grovesii]|uniref:Uncharacterized protein n=1 Tax=Diplogelasinospora grovesii TaxID=303347 RepID=A0AAN6S277_9PEZI|nr:hypothetical protein QBC46DRAFT_460280 [Diplogelasinospora grovesii]